ncbi:MAG: FMN-binding protein [Candidatus Binatia bacterium]
MRALIAAIVLLAAAGARGQEGVFLTEAEAPRAVFPKADAFERRAVPATAERRAKVAEQLGKVLPSMWEERWVVFRATREGTPLGQAFVVEEVGKHRPITFVVGLRPDHTVEDVAVMAYREAYGAEIRTARFLGQYEGKGPRDDLRAYRGVKNIAGATLSVEAASRAVHKAQAIAATLDAEGQ